ncbi:MAG: phage major capsid protein [Phycisphaerae bacterium]
MLNEKNITEGFQAAGERMDGLDSNVKELGVYTKDLYKMLLRTGRALGSGTLDGKDYHGFWPNEEMAKSFGEYVMQAVGLRKKDMGTVGGSGGDALVPNELARWIIQKLGKYGVFRRNATNVKMGSGTQIIPKVTSDLTVYCPGEGKEITKSDMNFGMVCMNTRKFACLTVINRELEEDAIAGLGEIVGISVARSMAKKEDLIGFMGDGTSPYFGMAGIIGNLLNVDDTITNIKGLIVGSGNAYSELTLADFRKVVGILPDDADDNAKWYMNKKFYYEVIYPLAETAGVANIFEILSDKKGRFLLGYPVEFVSCMPAIAANSQICALLGDLELGAYLGERRELEIARSDEVLFGNDQIVMRGTERIDINAFGVGDTEEAGPIVGLITAAA